nr:hypothetical protein Iba_chr15bCG8240 [Ipomoea batatas]
MLGILSLIDTVDSRMPYVKQQWRKRFVVSAMNNEELCCYATANNGTAAANSGRTLNKLNLGKAFRIHWGVEDLKPRHLHKHSIVSV